MGYGAGQHHPCNTQVHWGKEMSYNNYLDADAAYQCCCDYKE